jgi:hypothetical protein
MDSHLRGNDEISKSQTLWVYNPLLILCGIRNGLKHNAALIHAHVNICANRKARLFQPIAFYFHPRNGSGSLVGLIFFVTSAVRLILVMALADLKATGAGRFFLGRAGLWRYSRFSHDDTLYIVVVSCLWVFAHSGVAPGL